MYVCIYIYVENALFVDQFSDKSCFFHINASFLQGKFNLRAAYIFPKNFTPAGPPGQTRHLDDRNAAAGDNL